MSTKICHVWDTTAINWSNAAWRWSECEIIEEIVTNLGVDAETLIPPWAKEAKTEEEKRKQKILITMVCKVRGYKEREQTKEVQPDIKVTAEDISAILKTVGIELDVKV